MAEATPRMMGENERNVQEMVDRHNLAVQEQYKQFAEYAISLRHKREEYMQQIEEIQDAIEDCNRGIKELRQACGIADNELWEAFEAEDKMAAKLFRR
jgi:chromosome segregation ATPase